MAFGAASLLAAELDYSDYARLLETYVSDDGVRYAAWVESPADVSALDIFLEKAARADLAKMDRQVQKAFYINLYNASMLRIVLAKYPVRSVKDIGLLPFSVFKKKFIELGERSLSLDEVEKEVLLKEYFDPRIHFAVNCASESCPPLRGEPFRGAHLDLQLDEQTRLFAESARAARVDHERKRIAYSELFKWYAGDFGVENPADFLNRYRETDLPTRYKTDWIDYDWSLNAVKGTAK